MSELPKRERKQAELYKVEVATTAKSVSIQKGKGLQLSDYPFFLKNLEKVKGDDDVVKSLHAILFTSAGKKTEAKKNIRQFSGFIDEKSKSEKLAKVTENKKKYTVQLLKDIMGLFGLEKTGTRVDIIEKLMEYLMTPKVLKEESPSSGVKGKSVKAAPKAGSKRKAKDDGKAPKKSRAPTAYILFSVDARAEIKLENPDATFAELSSLVGQKWKAVNDTERKKWTDLASEKAAAMKESAESEKVADSDGEAADVDDDDEDLSDSGGVEDETPAPEAQSASTEDVDESAENEVEAIVEADEVGAETDPKSEEVATENGDEQAASVEVA